MNTVRFRYKHDFKFMTLKEIDRLKQSKLCGLTVSSSDSPSIVIVS